SENPSNVKLSPEVICFAPSPKDVAIPNTVAKTASVSIPIPIRPFTRSPSNGAKVELINAGALCRHLKYANAKATTAYVAQGWNPQWNVVFNKASSFAACVPASTVEGS